MKVRKDYAGSAKFRSKLNTMLGLLNLLNYAENYANTIEKSQGDYIELSRIVKRAVASVQVRARSLSLAARGKTGARKKRHAARTR